MKTVFKFRVLVAIMVIAATSCSKDDKESVTKLESGSFNGRITASVESSSAISDKIDYVFATADLVFSGGSYNFTNLGYGEYKSGSFTIVLSTPESSKLRGIEDLFQNVFKVSGTLKYTNPSAQATFVLDFLAVYEENENYYSSGIFRNRTPDETTMCVFVYVDDDVDVTASKNISVSLKQGWNRMYYSSGTDKNEVTTKNPGSTKWYYMGGE